MKHIYIYISALFVKIINAFAPIITKYFKPYKNNSIVKSLSGLLQNIPYINKVLENTNSITEKDKNCDLHLEKCKDITIVTGYMEHDPKVEALRKFRYKKYL